MAENKTKHQQNNTHAPKCENNMINDTQID